MKLAVICASGIGDALIFQTISHSVASQLGWETTTFSDHLSSFGPWLLPESSFQPQPPLDEIEMKLSSFDCIFLQHDNSPKAYRIKSLRRPIFTFYGAHLPSKHGSANDELDYICDRNRTMVDNVASAIDKFFKIKSESPGLTPPLGLVHRRLEKRIAIHPTASSIEKIWTRQKFIQVAEKLSLEGYEPVFTVSSSEASEWNSPIFPTLGHLASFLYESGAFLGNDSGTGHLASLLQVPHLIIAGNGLQMPLWRTGWHPGALLTPPRPLMRIKFFRERWKHLISANHVIKKFKESYLQN